MTDPSGVTLHQDRGKGDSVREPPPGLKLYIGFYAVAWVLALVWILGQEAVLLLLAPIPIVALYLLYELWNLKYWAWAVTILLHVVTFLLTFALFAFGMETELKLAVDVILTSVFVGYLYAKRGYFRQQETRSP